MMNRNQSARILSLGASLLFVTSTMILVGCDDNMEITKESAENKPTAAVSGPGGKDAKPAEGTHDSHGNEAASFYTVAHYDVEADPAAQLTETLKRAKAENKTVLLQVGGDWCGWCKLMTNYIDENTAVNNLMQDHFLIQKVTYDDKNKNEAFLSEYPKIGGYPHLFVLDSDGNLVHSQDTAKLEEGKGYSEEAFVAFLNKWKPAQEK